MKVAAAVLLMAAIVVLSVKLALAPYHRVYSAKECEAAYARARTHTETIAVDFKPFDDRNNAVDTRCSMVRGTRALSSSDILPR